MSLIKELQRRNVIRVATAYVVAAWLVIQVIETIFPAFGFTDRAIRITVIVLGIGFIPAVVSAWIFELTPEGLKRDEDARETDSKSGAKFLDRAIIVFLVLGISYFAFDKFVLAPERVAEAEAEAAALARAEAVSGFYGDRSIAVLPFDNLSADPEQVYFADGVAEEILNLLAGIRELRVISRSSSFAFREQALEIPEIAEQLDVAYVLEGSVRRAGNRVRVTAQLIEASTDTHLWSKTYERELTDVFRIQDEISADVARNLEVRLMNPLRSRRVDPEVLVLVQQARQIFEERRATYGVRMQALLDPALKLDPDNVPALKLMTLANWAQRGHRVISEEEFLDRNGAIEAKLRVLDPDGGFVEAGEGWDLMLARDFENSAKVYLLSLEKNLNDSQNLRNAAFLALHIGKTATAVSLLKHALAIDPMCHQCRRNLSRALLYAGEYERAIEVRERYRVSAGEGEADYALMLLMTGQAEKVLDLIPFEDSSGEFADLAYEAMANHSLGHTDRAEQLYGELEEILTHVLAAEEEEIYIVNVQYMVANAAAWMGKVDRAFEMLMPLGDAEFNFPRREVFSPVWNGIHDDPRWNEYRAAQGLPAERVDAIEFDPDLPE